MRIAVDLDGVCYDFHRTYRYMLREYRGVKMPPVEDCWDRWDAQEDYGTAADHEWMWNEGVDRGLFRYGHMIRGARRGLEALVDEGHHLAIVTHRPERAAPDTVDWLSLYMKGLPYTLHILSNGENKTVINWHMIVDDKFDNILDARAKGRGGVLFSRPWNEGSPWREVRARRASGWKEVVNVIRDEGQRREGPVRQRDGARREHREDLVASRYVGTDAAALGRAADARGGEVHAQQLDARIRPDREGSLS